MRRLRCCYVELLKGGQILKALILPVDQSTDQFKWLRVMLEDSSHLKEAKHWGVTWKRRLSSQKLFPLSVSWTLWYRQLFSAWPYCCAASVLEPADPRLKLVEP